MYSSSSSSASGTFLIVIIICLIPIALLVLYLISGIKAYKKMGLKGWEFIIPIYNNYVLFDKFFEKGWKFIYLYIPFYGAYMNILLHVRIAKSFDQDAGFGWGLSFLPLIFLPILGFAKNIQYSHKDQCNLKTYLESIFSNAQTNNFDYNNSQTVVKNKCPNCGTEYDDDDKFCIKCGTKL